MGEKEMAADLTGPVNLSGVDTETWLLRFDKNGSCLSSSTRRELLARLAADPGSPVIVFSHGWNNDFDDATTLYSRFLQQFELLARQHSVQRTPPVFVGIIWPSTWFPLHKGPGIAAAGIPDGRSEAEEALTDELTLAIPKESDRPRFRELIETHSLTTEAASELCGLMCMALNAAASEREIGAEGAEKPIPDRADMLQAMRSLENARGLGGTGGAPELLDEGGTADGTGAPLQDAGALDYLNPRTALRLASLYLMKDRAGVVGSYGVSGLLEDILRHTSAPVHAAGHSFGAKVMLSAITAGEISRKVDTLLLLQPAISYLSFAATMPDRQVPGGYRSALDKIDHSILLTYSAHDFPLHQIYHLAFMRHGDPGELRAAGGTAAGSPPNKFAALGGYGPRGANERLFQPLPEPGEIFAVARQHTLAGLDGTIGRRVDGHGDVATAYTAWLLLQQMAAL